MLHGVNSTIALWLVVSNDILHCTGNVASQLALPDQDLSNGHSEGMTDQQKRTESPLNAFYAALLSGKLTIGSFGSSFTGPNSGAAIKRKQEGELPTSELRKKQRPEQQKLASEPSTSAKPDQGLAVLHGRKMQRLKQQPAADKSGVKGQGQKAPVSGKKFVPTWQRVDSDNEDEGAPEDGAKAQQKVVGSSRPSVAPSSQSEKPEQQPNSSRIIFNSLQPGKEIASPANPSAEQRQAPSLDAASVKQPIHDTSHQPPISLAPLPARGLPGAQNRGFPSKTPAEAKPLLDRGGKKSTAKSTASNQQEATTWCVRDSSNLASTAPGQNMTSEQSILESLQAYFPQVQAVHQAAQVSDFAS